MRRTLLPMLLLLCQPLFTQPAEDQIFTSTVTISGRPTVMGFHVSRDRRAASVGYQNYERPSIPRDTEGDVWLPDSILSPDGVVVPLCWVSQGGFQQCSRITHVRLPKGLLCISDMAFQNCTSLQDISIPDSLWVFFPRAFQGCDALKRVEMHRAHPPKTYGDDTFSDRAYQRATLVIDMQSAPEYLTNPTFSRFRYHAERLPIYSTQQPQP